MPRKRARSYPSYMEFSADRLPPLPPHPQEVRAREKADREKPTGQMCVVCGKPRSRYAQYERCDRCRDQYVLRTTQHQRSQEYPAT